MEAAASQVGKNCSKLFELAATDNLNGFRYQVEKMGCDVNEVGLWYGLSFGSKKMSLEERTPIMIASLYGSTEVLKYIIRTKKVDLNRSCGSDRATALHCATAGDSRSSVQAVRILIEANADTNVVDVRGRRPGELIPFCVKSSNNYKSRTLDMLLNGNGVSIEEYEDEEGIRKKAYPFDTCLPDMNNGVYGSDEFRMYSFKVKPCTMGYSHDWKECPFVHPGENARRRDPSTHNYTCVPCPDYRRGICVRGNACEYGHGIFECWLHPAVYKTRLCKEETCCTRKVCFFAHSLDELRPLNDSTGSAMTSGQSIPVNSLELTSPSPQAMMSPLSATSQNRAGFSAREVDLDVGLLGLEKIRMQQRRQLLKEITRITTPYGSSSRIGELSSERLGEITESLDPSLLSKLQGLSPKYNNITGPHVQSPIGPRMQSPKGPHVQLPNRPHVQSPNRPHVQSPSRPHVQSPDRPHVQLPNGPHVQSSNGPRVQLRNGPHVQSPNGPHVRLPNEPHMQSLSGPHIRKNGHHQLRTSYPSSSNMSSSPSRNPIGSSGGGFDSSAPMAAHSRSSAFARRSLNFIDRRNGRGGGGDGYHSGASPSHRQSKLFEQGPPDGQVDWGFNNEDDVNKLTKSASFGYRNGNNNNKNNKNNDKDNGSGEYE
ncbi:hypothetical protein ABFS82_06G138900 [Erythranthe guttata]